MFSMCSKLYGIAPADRLWNSKKSFDPYKCFQNCIGLINYNEIPDDGEFTSWK